MSLTIDEQLLPLKTRTSFITYMPGKPDKYGLKFWIMTEVESKYIINILPYLGAQEKERRNGKSLAEDVVLRLVEPIRGYGYNICVDNFFASLSLARMLKSVNITMVGTMRKNRRELSSEMTAPNLPLHESTFYWQSEAAAMFVKYQCKPKKCVGLLCTMHRAVFCTSDEKRKPTVITYYNANKELASIFSIRCHASLCAFSFSPVASCRMGEYLGHCWHQQLDFIQKSHQFYYFSQVISFGTD